MKAFSSVYDLSKTGKAEHYKLYYRTNIYPSSHTSASPFQSSYFLSYSQNYGSSAQIQLSAVQWNVYMAQVSGRLYFSGQRGCIHPFPVDTVLHRFQHLNRSQLALPPVCNPLLILRVLATGRTDKNCLRLPPTLGETAKSTFCRITSYLKWRLINSQTKKQIHMLHIKQLFDLTTVVHVGHIERSVQ